MRKRVAALGIPSEIRRSGTNEITVALPDRGNLAPGGVQVSKTAQLDFYDWEPNVIGAVGKPAPSEGTVTGGRDAGAAQFGLTEYQAVLRAAKRAPIIRSNDTTLDPGCTPAQIDGCRYGVWYLLDRKHEKMLRGPEESEHSFYEAGYTPPADAVVTAMHVNPGTVLVQARPLENAAGKVINASPNSWYVLNDDPALTGSDLTNPQPAFEEGGKPDVTFDFTAHGKTAFEQVTKEIAHRGQEAQLPGVAREAALQHLAIVLDSQIITAPSIDFTKYPEGIDASTGSQISGGFTISSARNLASELRSGALPINLELVSRAPMQAG
jgi:SecD/SecF fusion protein